MVLAGVLASPDPQVWRLLEAEHPCPEGEKTPAEVSFSFPEARPASCSSLTPEVWLL